MDEFKNIFSSSLFTVICKPRLLTLCTLGTPASRVPRYFLKVLQSLGEFVEQY